MTQGIPNKILLLVPTRGRPSNCTRLLDVLLRTTTDVDVMFCVDDDDLTLPDYVHDLPPTCLTIGPPARLGPWLNKVGTRAAMFYPVVGFMGDDHLPETQGWDVEVLAALEQAGRYGMAYGDDGYMGEKLPTAVFMRSSLIAHLGWMVPPALEHLYIDDAWLAIGQKSGALRYLPGIKITHLHPAVLGGDMDETYRSANSKLQYAKDKRAFQSFIHKVLPRISFPADE